MSVLSDFVKKRKDLSKILLVSDLDGTLMNRENAVSEENKAALREFMELGGHFAMCSGRVIGSAEWLGVPADTPSILHNGGSIYDFSSKEILWTMPMDDEVRDLLKELQERFPTLAWTVYTAKEHFVLCHNDWSLWLSGIEGFEPSGINCSLEEITDPILKFVVPAAPEEIEEVTSYLDQKYGSREELFFSYNVSLSTLFEFTGSRSDKSGALKELGRICGVELENIIYMGDNMNDYNALEAAGLSVVPSSGLEAVRKVADYITVDQDENIMVDVLNEIKHGLALT